MSAAPSTMRYLRWLLALSLLAWLVLDPLLFLAEGWDLRTVGGYLTRQPEVVLLGDSVVYSAGHCDVDRRTVVALTADALGRPVYPVVHAGFGPGIYARATPWLARYNGRLRAVVLELNLRTFGPSVRGDPLSQFQRRAVLFDWLTLRGGLGPYLRLRYGAGEAAGEAAWRGLRAYDDTVALGTIGSVLERLHAIRPVPCGDLYGGQEALLGLRFAYNYGFPMTAEHPIFAEIARTLAPLRAAGVPVLLYLTPINLEAIAALDGDPLEARVRGNLALVRRVAAERGWPLLDLSAAVANAHFVDRFCACEHVDSHGRQQIAQAVAAALRPLLADGPR